jgi:acyl-CoA thioesterase FadM
VLTASSRDWTRGPYVCDWAFHRGDADGPLVAHSGMKALWVVPKRPNLYTVEPPPEYIRDFYKSIESPLGAIIPEVGAELGPLLADGGGESLASFSYDLDVALDETDFQGHLHYVNYFRWQGTARDGLLRSLGIPIADLGVIPDCLSSEVKFVRETLPFESVRVVAEVQAAYLHGLEVRIRFLRRNACGEITDTLAVGRHKMSLVQVSQQGERRPGLLPIPALETLGLTADLARAA